MDEMIADFSMGESDDFWDVEEEQLVQNQQKEKGKTYCDKEMNTDPYNDSSYIKNNCEKENHNDGGSDSFGDDELYSETDSDNQCEFIDLQELCDEIREDVKYYYRYVKGGAYTFYGRLKHEWSDWLYGDTFERDYVGVGIDDMNEDKTTLLNDRELEEM